MELLDAMESRLCPLGFTVFIAQTKVHTQFSRPSDTASTLHASPLCEPSIKDGEANIGWQ